MSVRVYKRGGQYYADIAHHGKRSRRSLKTDNLEDAERIAEEIRIELRSRDLRDRQQLTTNFLSIAEALELYFEHFNSRDVTGEHSAKTVRLLCHFAKLVRVKYVNDLNTAVVELAFDSLARDGMTGTEVSSRTVNYYRSIIKPFFAWLHRTDRAPKDYSSALRRAKKVATFELRPLTQDELNRLLLYAPIHRRVIYAVAAFTGLRFAEIQRVKLTDIVLSGSPCIVLPASKTKNRKAATVPLTDYLVDLLSDWINDGRPQITYVFNLDSARRPLKSFAAIHYVKTRKLTGLKAFASITSKTVGKDLDFANIPKDSPSGRVTFHSLRYTFVANLWRAGIPLHQAVKLSRHSDPKMTIGIYTKLDEQQQRSAVNKLNLLDPRNQ